MKTAHRSLGWIIALVALVGACSVVASPPPPSPGEPGIDGEWRLEAGTLDGQPIRVDEGLEPTLLVDGDHVGGRSHCNVFDGSIAVDGDRLQISAMSMTEMACLDGGLMDAEAAYLAALARATRFERADASMVLAGEGVELRFAVVPPVADAELTGTLWQLESLIAGDAVSSTVGEPATLELGADGTIHGSTGCRRFSGRYEASDEEVRVGNLVNDDRACADGVAAQDEHVLAVIADGFGYRIDGPSLTLTAGRGLGLGYLASD